MAVQWNATLTNLSYLSHDASIQRAIELGVTLVAVTSSIDTVVGVILNVFLLLTVLGSKALRRDVRNLLIVNVAVADLIVVAVFQPLSIVLALHGNWSYGCHLDLVLQLLHFFALNFVSVWGVVCLDALLLARLCRLDMPLTSFFTSAMTTSISTCKRRLDRAVVVAVLALPWVTSVIVITPIVFEGLHEFTGQIWTEQSCPFILVSWARLACNILFFFLPCLVACVLLCLTACVLCHRARGGAIQSITPSMPPTVTTLSTASLNSAASQDSPRAYVIANVLTFLLIGPRHVLSMLLQYQGMLTGVPTWLLLNLALAWLGESKSTFLPLVWLLALPDLKARARHLLTSAKNFMLRVKDVPRFDTSVSYKNMEA